MNRKEDKEEKRNKEDIEQKKTSRKMVDLNQWFSSKIFNRLMLDEGGLTDSICRFWGCK